MSVQFSACAAALSLFIGTALEAHAQTSPPTRATMIVAAAAGGGSDVQGRVTATALEQLRPGLTFTVENRPGGSTAIGYTYLAQQSGNSSFLGAAGPSLVSVPLSVKTSYTWRDFTPLAQIASDSLVVIVKADAPYKSLADIIEAGKKKELVAGVVAATGPDSVAAELLAGNQGITLRRVVFQASGETNAALLAGDVEFLIANPGEVAGHVKAGTMRAIATFGTERDPSLPDVPTAKEQGIDVVHGQWRGIIAPGKISDADKAFWIDALVEWSKSDSYRKYISDGNMTADFQVGDAFAEYLAKQEEILKGLLKQ